MFVNREDPANPRLVRPRPTSAEPPAEAGWVPWESGDPYELFLVGPVRG